MDRDLPTQVRRSPPPRGGAKKGVRERIIPKHVRPDPTRLAGPLFDYKFKGEL